MKTKEFISATRELGLNISENHVEIVITDVRDYEICNVSKLNCFSMNTRGAVFINLESDVKEKLLTYLYEYAKTPLEEREEEKKYVYRMNFAVVAQEYLKATKKGVVRFEGDRDFSTNEPYFKSKFTDAEVENYPKEVRELFKICEKIEVTSNA